MLRKSVLGLVIAIAPALPAQALQPTDVGFECPRDTRPVVTNDDGGGTTFHCNDPRGRMNGPTRSYSKDAKLLLSGAYENGVRSGTWTRYADAKPVEEAQYREGKLDGYVRSWDVQGTLLSDEFYANGKRSGLQRTYYPDGHVAREENYGSGPATAREFDHNGNLVGTGTLDEQGGRMGVWATYWSNGQPRTLESYQRLSGQTARDQLVELSAFDELGAPLDPDFLPRPCLPQVEDGECRWTDSKTWYARPSLPLGPILDSMVAPLSAQGFRAGFWSVTQRAALLLTAPRLVNGGAVGQLYRFRLFFDSCDDKNPQTCALHATANLLRMPAANGKFDKDNAQSLDDEVTKAFLANVDAAVKAGGMARPQ